MALINECDVCDQYFSYTSLQHTAFQLFVSLSSSLSLSAFPSLRSYFLNFFAKESKHKLAIMHSMCKRPSFLQSCSRLDIKYIHEVALNVMLASDITYFLHLSHLTNPPPQKYFNMEYLPPSLLFFFFFFFFSGVCLALWILMHSKRCLYSSVNVSSKMCREFVNFLELLLSSSYTVHILNWWIPYSTVAKNEKWVCDPIWVYTMCLCTYYVVCNACMNEVIKWKSHHVRM